MKYLLPVLIFLATSAQADSDKAPADVVAKMNDMLAACWAGEACEGSEALNYCGEAINAGGAPLEWVKCQNAEFDWWDAKLNEVYKERMATQKSYDADRGDPYHEDLLRDMQRAWIPFRDAACGFAARGQPGGSGAVNDGVDCMIRETVEQINFIQNPLR